MKAYQSGIANFEASETAVFGISTDFTASQGYWAKEVLKLTFPLLSDHSRTVAKDYGVLLPMGLASRATFVIDKEGKIVEIIENMKWDVHATGAETVCKRIKKS
jgi:peroxiredoxin